MKISYNWLKQYLDFNLSPEELSRLLTDCGLEVESLEPWQSVKGGLKGVVIGEVITCAKHPDADKLSNTTVDIGGGQVFPSFAEHPMWLPGKRWSWQLLEPSFIKEKKALKLKKQRSGAKFRKG